MSDQDRAIQIMANYICRIQRAKCEFERGKLAQQAYDFMATNCLSEDAPFAIKGVAWNFEIQSKLDQMTKHRDEFKGLAEYWHKVAKDEHCSYQPRASGHLPSVRWPKDRLEWEVE